MADVLADDLEKINPVTGAASTRGTSAPPSVETTGPGPVDIRRIAGPPDPNEAAGPPVPRSLDITHSAVLIMNEYKAELEAQGSRTAPLPDTYSEAARVQTSSELERRHFLQGYYFQFKTIITAYNGNKNISPEHQEELTSWFEDITDIVNAEDRVEAFLAENTPAPATVRQFNATILNAKGRLVSNVVSSVYDLNTESPGFGSPLEPWKEISFPDLQLSKAMYEDPSLLSRAFELAGETRVDIRDFGRNFPGSVQAYRQTDKTFTKSMKLWFDKKNNPNNYKDGDSKEKNELTDSLNFLEEMTIASAAHTVNKLGKIVTAQSWGSNICCVVKIFAIMQKIAIPDISVPGGALGGFVGAKAGGAVGGLAGDRAGTVGTIGGAIGGAVLGSSAFSANDKQKAEIEKAVAEIQSGKLSPEQKRKKIKELSSRINDIQVIVDFIRFINNLMQFHKAETSAPYLKVDITKTIGAFLYPLLKEEIRKLDRGWDASLGAAVLANGEATSLREQILLARENQRILLGKSLEEVAIDVNDDNDTLQHRDILARCLPVLEIFDEIVLPIIPNILKFVEDFIYEIFKYLQQHFAWSIDLTKGLSLSDQKNWLDTVIKWIEDNFGALIVSSKFCGAVQPSEEDVESYINSLSNALDNSSLIGEGISAGVSRAILDPRGIAERITLLKDKKEKNLLSEEEGRELKSLNVVSILWAK